MTDHDRIVALMQERAELKREKCILRADIRSAGLSFEQMKGVSDRVLEGVVHMKALRFAHYPNYEDLKASVARIFEIEKRVKEFEDCVPELK